MELEIMLSKIWQAQKDINHTLSSYLEARNNNNDNNNNNMI